MNVSIRKVLIYLVTHVVLMAFVTFAGTTPPRQERKTRSQKTLPKADFDQPPKAAFSRDDYFFKLDQLEHFYRVPGEFGYRLRGEDYGFEALSFIITETHPNGGPNLHVHDVEEAHVLMEGRAQYRIGDRTFTVQAPYVAKVPAGVPHTFLNVGTKPFNLVAVFASKRHNSKRLGPNPLVRAAPKK
jgi:mannose-6-phosphate isomerase-like protein (cupin superfamily)